MKKKLTFFQMMYCWIFVYFSIFKYKRVIPADSSCTILSFIKSMNFLCIGLLLDWLFDFSQYAKGTTGPFMICNILIITSIFLGDGFLFFRRRNEIFSIFADYPLKDKLRGRTIFWIYIIVTLITFGIGLYFGGKVEKPLLAI